MEHSKEQPFQQWTHLAMNGHIAIKFDEEREAVVVQYKAPAFLVAPLYAKDKEDLFDTFSMN